MESTDKPHLKFFSSFIFLWFSLYRYSMASPCVTLLAYHGIAKMSIDETVHVSPHWPGLECIVLCCKTREEQDQLFELHLRLSEFVLLWNTKSDEWVMNPLLFLPQKAACLYFYLTPVWHLANIRLMFTLKYTLPCSKDNNYLLIPYENYHLKGEIYCWTL